MWHHPLKIKLIYAESATNLQYQKDKKRPIKGVERPIKEIKRKGNIYWCNNNLNLKLKNLNNGTYLIYIEYNIFLK
jgi:hypothetical protein